MIVWTNQRIKHSWSQRCFRLQFSTFNKGQWSGKMCQSSYLSMWKKIKSVFPVVIVLSTDTTWISFWQVKPLICVFCALPRKLWGKLHWCLCHSTFLCFLSQKVPFFHLCHSIQIYLKREWWKCQFKTEYLEYLEFGGNRLCIWKLPLPQGATN